MTFDRALRGTIKQMCSNTLIFADYYRKIYEYQCIKRSLLREENILVIRKGQSTWPNTNC